MDLTCPTLILVSRGGMTAAALLTSDYPPHTLVCIHHACTPSYSVKLVQRYTRTVLTQSFPLRRDTARYIFSGHYLLVRSTGYCQFSNFKPPMGWTTAPVLVLPADCVTTGNGLKMASPAAYNLSDNHCYSIANFNFNLTLIPCSN